MVQDVSRYWDSLGAFHDPWGGVYFKRYYYPSAGQTPYRATVLEDALSKIPQALRASFEAQQEALKIYVPDIEVAAQEWHAVKSHGKRVQGEPRPIQMPGMPGPQQGQPSKQGLVTAQPSALPFMMGQGTQPQGGPSKQPRTMQQKLQRLTEMSPLEVATHRCHPVR